PVGVAQRAVFVESTPALIAKATPQVVLRSTIVAAVRQLARRHRHEEALGTFDDFQVADDEHVVERDTTKGLQPFVAARVFFHELDADFGDLDSRYSFTGRFRLRGRRSRNGPILVLAVREFPRPRRPLALCGTARNRLSRCHSSWTRRATSPGLPGRLAPASIRA